MERPMSKPLSYDPNAPYYTSKAIQRAKRRLEELHLREAIYAIDTKLKILEAMYPPQKADDEQQPSAVHNAPTSLQGEA